MPRKLIENRKLNLKSHSLTEHKNLRLNRRPRGYVCNHVRESLFSIFFLVPISRGRYSFFDKTRNTFHPCVTMVSILLLGAQV